MRMQGIVVKWNEDKGFGFIEPSDGGPDLFAHYDHFVHQTRRPQVGDGVSFERETNTGGKSRAQRILFDGERDPQRMDRLLESVFSLCSFAYLVGIAILVYVNTMAPALLLLYVGLSILTFLLYWRDKTKARKDEWRITERTLHSVSLMGGWPGAIVAQRFLHHKSRKQPFQRVFFMTVGLNIALVSLYTVSGMDFYNKNRIVQLYTQLSRSIASSPPHASNKRTNSAMYSWINKDGKRVYSNVGFPTDEPYRDGRIEMH